LTQKKTLLLFSVWGTISSTKTLSGLPFYLKNELKSMYNLEIIDSKPDYMVLSRHEKLTYRLFRFLEFVLFEVLKLNLSFHGAKLSWNYLVSKNLEKIIKKFPEIPILTFGLTPTVFISKKYKKQIFVYVDGIYSYKKKLYQWTKNKSSFLENYLYQYIEKKAFNRINTLFGTSEIIKSELIAIKQKNKSEVTVINAKIGANLFDKQYVAKVLSQPINILFIFTNFENKGGNIVLQLLESDLNLKIYFIGKKPENIPDNKNAVWVGYIDKSENEAKFNEILEICHINIMPTYGDLTPHTICECNAYGIPTIANNSGGIIDLIGEGGILIEGFEIEKYIDSIKKIAQNYQTASSLAFQKYDLEQKWKFVAIKISEQIEQ
jgi:glycosyltransferase involved in cell wall biosynthesis